MLRRRVLTYLTVFGIAVVGFIAYTGYFRRDPFVLSAIKKANAPIRNDIAVIFLSGDMGFDLGTSGVVMKRLMGDGIRVIGINSATFFRQRRTPAETAMLLADAANKLNLPKTARLTLIGQSYGADMLQAALPKVGAAMRARIKAVVLIAPTRTVYFQVSLRELLERLPPDADGIDTARLLTWVPTLCIHGVADKGSLCPQLVQLNVAQKPLPGGHLMHKDGNAIYSAMGSAL